MRKILFLLILFSLQSCKVKATILDEIASGELAMEFTTELFMKLNWEKYAGYLDEKLVKQISKDQIIMTYAEMHPYGSPYQLKQLGYKYDFPNNIVYVFIKGLNDINTYFYSIAVGKTEVGLKIVGFQAITNLYLQQLYNAGAKDYSIQKVNNLSQYDKSSFSNALIKQNKRNKHLQMFSVNRIIQIADDLNINMETLFQQYSINDKWYLVLKYRSGIPLENTTQLRNQTEIIWENVFKKIANYCEINGAVILAVENIDKSKKKNREQYGFAYKKNDDGLWEKATKSKKT